MTRTRIVFCSSDSSRSSKIDLYIVKTLHLLHSGTPLQTTFGNLSIWDWNFGYDVKNDRTPTERRWRRSQESARRAEHHSPMAKTFGSVHSRNADSKLVWAGIAQSYYHQRQLSKQGIRWPVSHDLNAGSSFDPLRLRVFLRSAATDRSLKIIFLTHIAREIFLCLWASGRTRKVSLFTGREGICY